jgi:hypothetical protein
MVLLPGCSCCAATCASLATFYNSATSLELDIESYDWERTTVYETKNSFCNLGNGSTVTGRVSSPWSALNGSYSLTKYSSNSTGSTWRHQFTSPCSGVFGFFDPPRIDIGVSIAGLSILVKYITYSACDYLGGSLSDTCTINADVQCSGSPLAITQRYKRSPAQQEKTSTISCDAGFWASTEIGVTTNTFPSPAFSESIAVPDLGPCTINDAGIQYVGPVSSSTSGDPVVKIKNLKFVF